MTASGSTYRAFWRPLNRRGDKQIHLRPSLALLGDFERQHYRVPERYWSHARQEIGVLRLVPVGGELIWRADVQGDAVEGECLSRLEPGSEGLLGELLSSAIEQPAPSFVGSQRHDDERKKKRGGAAKLEIACGKINQRRHCEASLDLSFSPR